MVCVLALIQTMAVHQLYWWSEQQQLALVVDRVCTATILYFLFPIVVLGCILVDFESTFGIGLFLLIAVLPLSGLTAYMRIRATLRKQAREARAAIGALVSLLKNASSEIRRGEVRAASPPDHGRFDCAHRGGPASDAFEAKALGAAARSWTGFGLTPRYSSSESSDVVGRTDTGGGGRGDGAAVVLSIGSDSAE